MMGSILSSIALKVYRIWPKNQAIAPKCFVAQEPRNYAWETAPEGERSMKRAKTIKQNKRGEEPKGRKSRLLHPSNSAARERALRALAAMRRGYTLSRAARDNGVTVRTIKRYVGPALVQDRPGGRIRTTKSGRLVRYLQIPGPDGPRDITVRGSKAASQFANYKAAINRLLRGDRDAMAAWQGKKIAGIELITDTKTLVEQARKEILPYSLYRSLSGSAA
jgi:hypothetical protein